MFFKKIEGKNPEMEKYGKKMKNNPPPRGGGLFFKIYNPVWYPRKLMF